MSSESTKQVLVLAGGRGWGQSVRASALVSTQGFGVRYDLDQEAGIIGNRDHDLFGQSITGKILVFTQPKGGVAASWSLAGLNDRGMAPAGIVFRRASPIFVQGAIFAGIPIIDSLEDDPCDLAQTGDEILLLPDEGRIEIFR